MHLEALFDLVVQTAPHDGDVVGGCEPFHLLEDVQSCLIRLIHRAHVEDDELGPFVTWQPLQVDHVRFELIVQQGARAEEHVSRAWEDVVPAAEYAELHLLRRRADGRGRVVVAGHRVRELGRLGEFEREPKG